MLQIGEIEFWTEQTDLSKCDIGSIVISKSTLFLAWGSTIPDKSASRLSAGVQLLATQEISCSTLYNDPDLDQEVKISTPEDVSAATEILLSNAPLISHIAVSAFGPFYAMGRDNRGTPDYGKFRELTNHREWKNKELFPIIKKAALRIAAKHEQQRARIAVKDKTYSIEPKVIISLDVNVAALGEHWWHVLQQYQNTKEWVAVRKRKISVVDVNRKYLRYARQSTAYVKISHSVNVGFTDQGWIGRGRHHAQMSAFMPRKIIMPGYIDRFPGSCSVHGDCIEGLVSTKAISKRLSREGIISINEQGAFLRPPEDHPVMDLNAEYIAQLLHVTVCLLSPHRIALGGVVVSNPNSNEGGGWEPLLQRVRDRFYQKVRPNNRPRGAPHYPELDDENFIAYRSCKYPGLFGGLILARWDKTNEYPIPLQV